jgi:hypothetical protein
MQTYEADTKCTYVFRLNGSTTRATNGSSFSAPLETRVVNQGTQQPFLGTGLGQCRALGMNTFRGTYRPTQFVFSLGSRNNKQIFFRHFLLN